MPRIQSIQYGFNREGIYARFNNKAAYLSLDFENMKPENNFEEKYSIESDDASSILPYVYGVIWTKKVPVAIKNAFREHFGMKPLKDDGKEVLLGGMTYEQFLCKEARLCATNSGHDMKPFKKSEHYGKTVYNTTCKKCGEWLHVNPNPAPNETDISGSVFGVSCKRGVQ